MTTFTPPVEEGVAWGDTATYPDHLFKYYGAVPTGATVWKDQNDEWHQSQYPYDGRVDEPGLRQAKQVYLGGHVHSISASQAAELEAAGYGDRINLEPVRGSWTKEELAKFESKLLLTADGSHATGPPFVSDGNDLKIQLSAGTTPGQSQLREFFLHSDTDGWTDTHGIVRIDPPLYQADVDGNSSLDIIPQMGIALRCQFNSSTGKNQGITMNNGTFLALPILNIGAWHAFPDGSGFANRQFSWPFFENFPLPYGWEYYLEGNIIRVRIFPAGEEPNYTPWDHPTHARTLNLDVDCGSTAVVPTPTGEGTNAILSAHLGTDSRSATRIQNGFLMERLL